MSDPVIKAKAMCCEVHGLYRSGASNCPMCKPLYGPDDLVRVALATFEWAGFKVDPEGAEGKAANRIVDRLTKGET